ncbi:MAG TPA: hypothetical protein VFF28_02670 [Candidatus Nanoarchaeia archaeon]|nr:hypothetical protein [Candidatus Nanoarchaeia archaeon]
MADRYRGESGFRKTMDEVKDNMASMRANFEDKVAEEPMKSMIKAFVIGAVVGGALGMLMRRR